MLNDILAIFCRIREKKEKGKPFTAQKSMFEKWARIAQEYGWKVVCFDWHGVSFERNRPFIEEAYVWDADSDRFVKRTNLGIIPKAIIDRKFYKKEIPIPEEFRKSLGLKKKDRERELGTRLLLRFIECGIPVYNHPYLDNIARDKWLCYQILRDMEDPSIIIPETYLVNNKKEALRIIERKIDEWDGIVLKPRRSGAGYGVKIIRSKKGIQVIKGKKESYFEDLLIQQYIPYKLKGFKKSISVETRTFRIFGKYFSGVLRYFIREKKGMEEYGANIRKYLSGEKIKSIERASEKILRLLEKFARKKYGIPKKLSDFKIVAVDFIPVGDKLAFIEVNTKPSFYLNILGLKSVMEMYKRLITKIVKGN